MTTTSFPCSAGRQSGYRARVIAGDSCQIPADHTAPAVCSPALVRQHIRENEARLVVSKSLC